MGRFMAKQGVCPTWQIQKLQKAKYLTGQLQLDKEEYLYFYLKSTVQVDLLLSVGAVGVSQQVRLLQKI